MDDKGMKYYVRSHQIPTNERACTFGTSKWNICIGLIKKNIARRRGSERFESRHN